MKVIERRRQSGHVYWAPENGLPPNVIFTSSRKVTHHHCIGGIADKQRRKEAVAEKTCNCSGLGQARAL